MIETLIKLLKANKEVSDYEISFSNTKSAQLFYVLDKLETNRVTNNSDISVAVYHDFDEYRGSSNFMVNAADDEESVRAKIENAVNTAKKIKNPKFNLVEKSDQTLATIKSIECENLSEVALKAADAIMAANHHEEGWINSVEVFVRHNTHRFINSRAVDLSFEKTSLEAEIIPTWKGKEEEIELYLDFKLINNDYAEITRRTEKILEEAHLRSIAAKVSPEMTKVPVVMSGEMLALVMNNFEDDIAYSNVYTKSNHYKLNDEVTPYPLKMTLKAYLDGALSSRPYDGHGNIIEDKVIIEDGKVKDYWGDIRFGQYLNVVKPSGTLAVMQLEVAEDRKCDMPLPSVEILNFSSPQLESTSGYFGGEVRLGLYRDEKGKVTPISAFSVSGNIYEAIKNARFANTNETLEDYYGPKFIVFDDCQIQ